MIAKVINLQDSFLNQVRIARVPIVIYLTDGKQMSGSVKGFDSFTVILESMGKQQLLYKRNVLAVASLRPFIMNLTCEAKMIN